MHTGQIETSIGSIATQTPRISAATVGNLSQVVASPARIDKYLARKFKAKRSLELKEVFTELSKVDVAENAIKIVTKSLINLKHIIMKAMRDQTSETDLEFQSKMKMHKRYLNQALSSEFNSGVVLSYDLSIYSPASNRVEFRLEGLDLERFQWNDEIVTLRFDNQIAMLQFRGDLALREQINLFNKTLGFNNMFCKASNGQLIFSMLESDWRSMNKTIGIMGEGYRFPAGQLLPVPITSANDDILAIVESIHTPSEQSLNTIEQLFNLAKSAYLIAAKLKMKAQVKVVKSLNALSLIDNFVCEFSDKLKVDKLRSIFEINILHADLNKSTATSLLQ